MTLTEVSKGGGLTTSARVDVFDTSHGQKLLGDWSTDDACSSRGWDEAHANAAAFAGHLERNLEKIFRMLLNSDNDSFAQLISKQTIKGIKIIHGILFTSSLKNNQEKHKRTFLKTNRFS